MTAHRDPPAAATPSAATDPPHGGRPVALTFLAWSLAVVVLMTLAPFRFRVPETVALAWRPGGAELIANCALLALPGFLLRAATGTNRDVYCLGPLLAGAAFATAIEAAQAAIPGRVPSPVDVAANGFSAWFGAMAFDSIRRNLDLRAADRLFLRLPLTGLVLLLVPLLWVTGEAAGGDGRRVALTLPLGLMGGGILAAVWHHRLRPEGLLSPWRIAAVAAVWFVVAAASACRHRPLWLVAETLIVAAATRAAAAWPWFLRADGLRFEIPTLRRVGPLFVAYLAVLAAWPWRFDVAPWALAPDLPDVGDPPRLLPIVRLVEYFAAFSVAGYLVAESRGRRGASAAGNLAWAVLPCTTFAVSLELLRGYAPGYGASVVRPLCAAVGAALGAVAYRQQLAAMRRTLAPVPSQAPGTPAASSGAPGG